MNGRLVKVEILYRWMRTRKSSGGRGRSVLKQRTQGYVEGGRIDPRRGDHHGEI